MNFRNKYLSNGIRVLFGLLMFASGLSGLLMGPEVPDIPENLLKANMILWDTGILQMIKVTELVAGLMLVINFLPALAAIFLAPVAVGIIVFQSMMAPEFLPIGIVVAVLEAYLGYLYWDKYKCLYNK